ncbi:MAG: NFACT RNA binding domain-containing protein [Melioribacteraceae bacterium]|nr:NFACT RNA binding domain-containing protein [Melioribacteraceae bacterium]
MVDIQIAELDRIIKIVCEHVEILITIRGTLSNVILLKNGEHEFFKKLKRVEENQFVEELTNHNFTSEFNLPKFDKEIATVADLRKKYTYLTKDITNEVKARTSSDNIETIKEIYRKVIKQIETDPVQIFFSNDVNRYVFIPSGYISLSRDSEIQEFDKYQDALVKLLAQQNRFSREENISKQIEKYLEKELSGVSQKLNSLRKRVEEGSKEKEYRHIGDLLISNLHQIKKGMKEITLKDFQSDKEFKIKLNDTLSPKQNVDYYYDKARGEKINYEKSKELFTNAEQKYNRLQKLKEEFENTDDLAKLQSIKDELGIKDKRKVEQTENQSKFRHFIIEGKYNVYVGRDSKSNDKLSIKFAKQNDYWFHARGYPGSHVVLRVDNPKEGVPKNILKDAASIAAYYSKAKTAGTVPVAYTFAKYVTKRKGMEPGKVYLQKENVLLVKPEIPKNAEQVED